MSVVTYATAQDCDDVFPRPLTEREITTADKRCAKASVMLRQACRANGIDLDATIRDSADRADMEELAKSIVVAAVNRTLKNPMGYRQHTLTDGPFSENMTHDNSTSTGELYISDSELEQLVPGMSGVATIGHVRIGSVFR